MTRGRCTAHGLALGDDGGCVLCRRSESPRPTRRAITASATSLILVLFACFLTYRAVVAPQISPESFSVGSAASPGDPPQPTNEPAAAPSTGANVAASPPTGSKTSAISTMDSVDSARQAQRARAEQAKLEAWAHHETELALAEDDARARRNASPGNEVRGSRGAPARSGAAMTMYSASWCGVCRAARSYMLERGIPFTERDIDADPSARNDLRRLNPAGSIPTFDIDGRTLVGFRAESLERALGAGVRAGSM